MTASKDTVLQVRMTRAEAAALAAYVAKLSRDSGVQVSRSEAVRSILARATGAVRGQS